MLFRSAAPAGQHEHAQAAVPSAQPAVGTIAQCATAQRAVVVTLDATAARLDAARQTNSPSAMRAAIDEVDSVLRDIRLKLAPCAALQAPAADPHTGHVMPDMSGGQPVRPAVK